MGGLKSQVYGNTDCESKAAVGGGRSPFFKSCVCGEHYLWTNHCSGCLRVLRYPASLLLTRNLQRSHILPSPAQKRADWSSCCRSQFPFSFSNICCQFDGFGTQKHFSHSSETGATSGSLVCRREEAPSCGPGVLGYRVGLCSQFYVLFLLKASDSFY